jgi:N-acetylmuramoyl-L-alanine amidase
MCGQRGSERQIRSTSLRLRRRALAALVAFALLPAGASEAGWLSNLFKGKDSKQDNAQKSAPSKPSAQSKPNAADKPATEKSEKPVQSAAPKCDPAKLRIAVDVGHTKQSDGAMSARDVPEYSFNLNLAQRVVAKLKSEGFAETRLLVTEGKARPSLIQRVASANGMKADIFLSIHHDSVPDKFKEKWVFEGKKLEYSDRFSGHSLFVSKDNPFFETSFNLAKLIGRELKAKGLKYADQYASPIMGKYRHDLLDKDVGIYRYDHLVVLMTTHMPAVLLEAGSIINRDEEVQMASPERQDMITSSIATAFRKFCGVEPETATSEKKN